MHDIHKNHLNIRLWNTSNIKIFKMYIFRLIHRHDLYNAGRWINKVMIMENSTSATRFRKCHDNHALFRFLYLKGNEIKFSTFISSVEFDEPSFV